MRSNRGFTLVEALIALVIAGLLGLAVVPSLGRLYDYFKLHQVMMTLQSDLHYVREANMLNSSEGDGLTLRIYHGENRYELRTRKGTYLKRQFPAGVHTDVKSGMTDIYFTHNGTISKGQTIVFASQYYKKKVVLSIGFGGLDIRN